MSSQYEIWYFIKDNNVYKHGENDGYALMRKGRQEHDELLGTVDEVKAKWPSWFKKEFNDSLQNDSKLFYVYRSYTLNSRLVDRFTFSYVV